MSHTSRRGSLKQALQLSENTLSGSLEFLSSSEKTIYLISHIVKLNQRMKNPFLNTSDIFSKIDNTKKPSIKVLAQAPSSDKLTLPSHYPSPSSYNPHSSSPSIYSPLTTANYSSQANKPHPEYSVLNPIDTPFNREIKVTSSTNHGFRRDKATTSYNSYENYPNEYSRGVNVPSSYDYYSHSQYERQPTATFQIPSTQPAVSSEYQIASPTSNYIHKAAENRYQTHLIYNSATHNSSNQHSQPQGSLDCTQLKTSTFEINKMERELSHYLSNKDNIEEISKLFGLNAKSSSMKSEQNSFNNTYISCKPSRGESLILETKSSAKFQMSTMDLPTKILDSEEHCPFIVVGQDDENFYEEEDGPLETTLNCSLLNMGIKNKGQLFCVTERTSSDTGFHLKRQLQKQISAKCCRQTTRVFLTGGQKIRVRQYQL